MTNQKEQFSNNIKLLRQSVAKDYAQNEAFVKIEMLSNGNKYITNSCTANPFTVISSNDTASYNNNEEMRIDFTEKEDKPFFSQYDDMGWKDFWAICKENFPLHSVNGCAKNEKECEQNERSYVETKIKPFVKRLKGKKILEIGYGYGYTGLELIEKHKADYYGIDYVSSNQSILNKEFNGKKRFFEINKSGIPEEMQNEKFDIIFSFNVFQHLTREQRNEYFEQMSKCLSPNGIVLIDCFEWGGVGEPREDFNTKFFGVLTSIDTPSEVKESVESNGLAIDSKTNKRQINGDTNVVIYKLVKPR